MADPSYDFVIVGGGGGGLAAAIKAKLLGIRALLLEKTPLIGGSSILSGGVIWMPNNPLMRRDGIKDSREAALTYMAQFVGQNDLYSTPARREAFVDAVDEFMTTMEAQGMKYRRCHNSLIITNNCPAVMRSAARWKPNSSTGTVWANGKRALARRHFQARCVCPRCRGCRSSVRT